jgi:thiosulfate/3-mercaptopyruvate sulfurtransferase
MLRRLLVLFLSLGFFTVIGAFAAPLQSKTPAKAPAHNGEDVPQTELIQPADLAKTLAGPESAKPLILQVGSKVMFDQGHIPGSEYAGPGGQPDGRAVLTKHVRNLPREKAIVLYCGCCPWDKCPNIRAAYWEMRKLFFVNVKVLYIPQDYGADWVAKGYPSTGTK